MTAETYSFFSAEFCDNETGLVVHEVYLENFREDESLKCIQDKLSELKANQFASLERGLASKCTQFRTGIGEWDKLPIRLRHESSVLPYRVHGGREFDLMMKGLKPLSVFSCVESASGLASYLSKYFEPLVASGRLVSAKLDDEEGDDASVAPTLMYALPNEAWRIEAYRLMKSTARATKWNDALERIEGSLLGYTHEQNNSWMSYLKKKGRRWGHQIAYRFLIGAEVDFLRKTGCKAFSFGDNPIRLYLSYDSSEQRDPIAALTEFRQATLARFYVPMAKMMGFFQGVTKISDCDFGVFELPGSESAKLNELIDGIIEIVEF